jgi:hypothetical protein
VLLLLTLIDRTGRIRAKEYEQIRMQQQQRLVIVAMHPVGSILLNNNSYSYIVAMTGTARLPRAKDIKFRTNYSKVTTTGNLPDTAAHASTRKVAASIDLHRRPRHPLRKRFPVDTRCILPGIRTVDTTITIILIAHGSCRLLPIMSTVAATTRTLRRKGGTTMPEIPATPPPRSATPDPPCTTRPPLLLLLWPRTRRS